MLLGVQSRGSHGPATFINQAIPFMSLDHVRINSLKTSAENGRILASYPARAGSCVR